MTLEQRIEALEKENAELKRQLAERPKCIKIPLSAIKFDDQFYSVERLNSDDLKAIVSFVEQDLEKQLNISISFNQCS